ncbi:accessory gene regulator B family protein [Clostridium swellfunianum]|uniref:accessory gene regulator B family protein n=1 Tax=Clostridium swellfunianum TaxID=1367462 RepID=UPI00202F4FDF|nr:accessory gene regulator B family protein [Clostridium swellfunianum]MCM0647525.1 accessory gene regulator B family protein [Clostridium swellfunianum]
MIDKIALQLTSFICTEAYDNTKDRAKIQYALSVILSEGFKIIFLLLFFSVIHRQSYFYFSLVILMSIRVFAGGVHVKGALNCLLLTVLMFSFTSIAAPLMPRLPYVCYVLSGIASLAIVLVKAPICSVRRPIKDKKIKLKYKLIAAISTALWIVILSYLEAPAYVNCGFSTIIVQNIQLMLVKKAKY